MGDSAPAVILRSLTAKRGQNRPRQINALVVARLPREVEPTVGIADAFVKRFFLTRGAA